MPFPPSLEICVISILSEFLSIIVHNLKHLNLFVLSKMQQDRLFWLKEL